MIARTISSSDLEDVLNDGEVIADYAHDKPYPSYLLFKFVKRRALHVVIAYNKGDETCIIVTCYEPDPTLWDVDFKRKKV